MVVDDGILNDCCGLLLVDDEGILIVYNVFIEDGILKGYM